MECAVDASTIMNYRFKLSLLLIATLLTVGPIVMAADTPHSEADLSTPLTLQMHDVSSNTVTAQVVAIKREPSGTFIVNLHVSPETWEHINEYELFHTERNRRVGDIEGRFEPDIPIEIETALDQLVVDSLQLTDTSPEELAARLASIQPNTLDMFLLYVQSWIARTVTQEVPLPPELQGKGSISAGFRMERAD